MNFGNEGTRIVIQPEDDEENDTLAGVFKDIHEVDVDGLLIWWTLDVEEYPALDSDGEKALVIDFEDSGGDAI